MLKIKVKGQELFNDITQEFFTINDQEIELEHSLLSVSKWEAKWHKPFLETAKTGFTPEEEIDYVRCMTINKNVDPRVYYSLSQDNRKEIESYINDPMTATTITHIQKRPNREIVTSEIIYYWMVSFQIPFDCQKWHLARLMTLIEVCSIKNDPNKKKMRKNEIAQRNRALNAERKAKYNNSG